MRRRKKKDKMVLKPRYGRSKPKNKRMIRRPPSIRGGRNPQTNYPRKTAKTSKTTLFLIIISLIAFVVGAGIGISMAMDDSSNQTTVDGETYENVTVEMTSNLNNTTIFDSDENFENIDYNNKEDIAKYNLSIDNTTY